MTCNAAMRDGEWKLVRPAIKEAMYISPEECSSWNVTMRYKPEKIRNIIHDPEPSREIPPPPPPELYNITKDPGEKDNLADKYPDRVAKMVRELEAWFEEVEAERRLGI